MPAATTPFFTGRARSWPRTCWRARSWCRRTRHYSTWPKSSVPRGRPDDDKGLDRTRAKRAGRTLGPRARPLPRLRRAGRRIPPGPHHRRLRTAHSTGRKRKPPEDPPQGLRITRFHGQPRPPQAAPSEHQPRRRGLQPPQLLARSRLARDELALVVVSGRLGTKEKSGPAQGPRPRATL